MENVLVALVIIFLILFAALTLSNAVFSTQAMLSASQVDTESRLQQQSRTQLELVNVKTHAGTEAQVILRNTGSVKLADFDQWDVIVQYFDDAVPSGLHISWLPFATPPAAVKQWTVEGIYANAVLGTPEVYEPHILNPGEEALFDVRLSPPIGVGTYAQLVIAAPNGVSTSTIFKRNVPPVLATNSGLLVNSGESVTIDTSHLKATDVDNEAKDLVYTVTVPPTQGTLTPQTTFTQADIDNGLLQYTDTGAPADTFEFTISDGQDSIGPFTVNIAVNMPPVLDVNTGIVVPKGLSGLVGDLLLKATDPDNTAAELVFTVTVPPTEGSLSMTTFSQDDINDAKVSYTNTNTTATSDSFEVTVTDGHKVVGPFMFAITVT
jgi:cadherin-like protein